MLEMVYEFIDRECIVTSEMIADRFGWELPKTRDVMERLYSRGRIRRAAIKGGRFKFWEIA